MAGRLGQTSMVKRHFWPPFAFLKIKNPKFQQFLAFPPVFFGKFLEFRKFVFFQKPIGGQKCNLEFGLPKRFLKVHLGL